jgi:uncharacterized coiled-coil DUF342 family protein
MDTSDDSKGLVDKIVSLEHQIESIKKQLSDTSAIDDLNKRIANCENLAGISSPKLQE